MTRRRALRVGGWALVLSVTICGLGFTYPGGPTGLLHDVREYGRNSDALAANAEAERDIDSARAAAADRQQMKADFRGQLARGTMPLSVAADEYLWAVAADPALLERFRVATPAATDEERVAINLVRDVFLTTPLTGDDQRRLLAEFRTAYQTDYPLPVPPPVDARTSADPRP
jgi:hypothetical protein